PARPVIPTAPAYATSVWRPTADEITRFFTKAQEMGLTAANAWSWDYSRQAEYVDLWNAVADFDWPPIPPSEEMPDQLIERLNQHDPAQMVELYHDQAAHVTGARTVVGKDGISEWYRMMFQQLLPDGRFSLTGKSGDENSRHFTWTATSLSGSVADGSDTLGMRSGRIQYHYSYFTIA
ncbi:MAG: nuclear transport factor 2 family protein, partial [Anaerolineales bacterium]